jgi:hypothetical protein
MRADLDELLAEAGREPTTHLDPDEIWARGRRRRAIRRASTALAGVAGVVVLGLAVTSFAVGGTAVPEVEPLAPPTEDEVAEDVEAATDEASDDAEPAEPGPPPDRAPADGAPSAGDDVAEEPPADAGQTESLDAPAEPAPAPPEPDPAAVADPCAAHQGRDLSPFVDLVSPVDGQVVAERVELVGCASVYEATVRYRLVDAAGRVLVDEFTTASAAGPELGEFRASVRLDDVTGALTVEAFWEDAADGRERDVVGRRITVE